MSQNRFARVSILLVATACGALGSQTARADRRDDRVVIFADSNFAGPAQELRPGAYDTAQLQIGNDQLSSLHVPPGMVVVLFEDTGFQGRSRAFTSDTPFVGPELNDKTSSIVVSRL